MDEIHHKISHHKLNDAIRLMRNRRDECSWLRDNGNLDALERDYGLMLDYMMRGVRDEKRDEVFAKFVGRAFRCLGDMTMRHLCHDNSVYRSLALLTEREQLSVETMRERLETFVGERTMLTLLPEEQKAVRSAEIYRQHHELMKAVFATLVVAPQWSNAERGAFLELLLSPTVESMDAQVMTSAITLSCMAVYDINKWRLLVELYRRSTDLQVRQRALVGWAFTLYSNRVDFPAGQAIVDELTSSSEVCRELLELQIQVFYCQDAEKDTRTIQRDIMPDLVKNSHLNITRFGITEKEDDTLNDILHPEAEEKAMEDMEKHFHRMLDMQKQGSDIYFGGFSQMKKFGFFYTMMNWFVPFYQEHPDLAHVSDKIKGKGFFRTMLTASPFCDSDKYSFVLAMVNVYDKMPDSVKEMLDGDAMFAGHESVHPEDAARPAFVRLMYLQDLYRFFRLYNQHNELSNPFDSRYGGVGPSFFFMNAAFKGTAIDDKKGDLSHFLLKRERFEEFDNLLSTYGSDTDKNYQLLCASGALRCEDYASAIVCLRRALNVDPTDTKALRLLGKALLMEGDNTGAATVYNQLLLLLETPPGRGLLLNYSIARLKSGEVEQAMKDIFRLEYEYPNDADVRRVLAWGYLLQGKTAEAIAEYGKLESPIPGDHLNCGYCHWLDNNIQEAVRLFRSYAEECGLHHLEREFKQDFPYLKKLGIVETDCELMLELVDTD